ncbi:MAG: DUF1801 domain-containing protein [Thaumarchaeota archaeon]|nr:DUF1801 domain-containing protein [Nitrososphaerota archaeon]
MTTSSSGKSGSKDVDDFVKARVVPEFQGVVALLRRLVRECAPEAEEMMSYGIPAYKGRRMLAVINPTKKGVAFSFGRGADFEDKYGLLQGVGKVAKHVRLGHLDDANEEALRYYIVQAVRFDADRRPRARPSWRRLKYSKGRAQQSTIRSKRVIGQSSRRPRRQANRRTCYAPEASS